MIENVEGRRTVEAIFMPEGGTVTWVNDDISKLKVKVGDTTHMPFLYEPDTRKHVPFANDRLVVDVDGQHRRHSTIGSININGLDYQVVLKGTGLLSAEGYVREWRAYDKTFFEDPERDLRGLCGEREALLDARIAQIVNRLGGFCAVPLVISAYKKIPDRWDADGRMQYATVSELQQRGRVPASVVIGTDAGSNPIFDKERHVENFVTYARALETNVRIDDRRTSLIRAEIIRLIQSLTHNDEITEHSIQGFVERSARRMGATLGTLHALGLRNPELGGRNITLDGTLTDLSACMPLKEPHEVFKSQERIELTLCLETLVEECISNAFNDIDTLDFGRLNDRARSILLAEYHLAVGRTQPLPELEHIFE